MEAVPTTTVDEFENFWATLTPEQRAGISNGNVGQVEMGEAAPLFPQEGMPGEWQPQSNRFNQTQIQFKHINPKINVDKIFDFTYYSINADADRLFLEYDIPNNTENKEYKVPGFIIRDGNIYFVGSSRDMPYLISDGELKTEHMRLLEGINDVKQIGKVYTVMSGIELGQFKGDASNTNIVPRISLAAYEYHDGDGNNKKLRVNTLLYHQDDGWIELDGYEEIQEVPPGTEFETYAALCIPRFFFSNYTNTQKLHGRLWIQFPRFRPMHENRLLKFEDNHVTTTDSVWDNIESQFCPRNTEAAEYDSGSGFGMNLNPKIRFGELQTITWTSTLRKQNVIIIKKKEKSILPYVFVFPDVYCHRQEATPDLGQSSMDAEQAPRKEAGPMQDKTRKAYTWQHENVPSLRGEEVLLFKLTKRITYQEAVRVDIPPPKDADFNSEDAESTALFIRDKLQQLFLMAQEPDGDPGPMAVAPDGDSDHMAEELVGELVATPEELALGIYNTAGVELDLDLGVVLPQW